MLDVQEMADFTHKLTVPIKQNNSCESKEFKIDRPLVSMIILTSLSNSAYGLVAPILPFELVRKGVPVYLFGWIFGFYSVAVILCSPFVGYML